MKRTGRLICRMLALSIVTGLIAGISLTTFAYEFGRESSGATQEAAALKKNKGEEANEGVYYSHGAKQLQITATKSGSGVMEVSNGGRSLLLDSELASQLDPEKNYTFDELLELFDADVPMAEAPMNPSTCARA